jgi:hypothetical protein
MRKTVSADSAWQPCQVGSSRPRQSLANARPTVSPSTVIVSPARQTVARECQNMLQERYAFGQVAAIGEIARQRLR